MEKKTLFKKTLPCVPDFLASFIVILTPDPDVGLVYRWLYTFFPLTVQIDHSQTGILSWGGVKHKYRSLSRHILGEIN